MPKPTRGLAVAALRARSGGTKVQGDEEKHDCQIGWRTVRCGPMLTRLTRQRARIRRTKWSELSCLLCGESAATLEGGSVLRPRAANSVRVTGTRVICGRCGGSLSPTDQGERVDFV
jgi:hypothetical protein